MSEKSLNSQKLVVVGMSGGVDSSVAAYLLKEQGYRVIGIFMKNWEEVDESGECTSAKDYRDVVSVCEALDIPYYSLEFVEEYKEKVFKDFLKEYELGYTPNPDILCNREIKFKVFFEKAMELGADYLATGHYARVQKVDDHYSLIKAVDESKDQSYFLYTLKSEILKKTLFPLGNILKKEVRAIASKLNLSTKEKKDSTGICFIGERKFSSFLSGYIKKSQGPFKNLKGEVVGFHKGQCFYTIGQRKGLGLGGPGEPWFVVDKKPQDNEVIVERGLIHPALFASYLTAVEVSWVHEQFNLVTPMNCKAKIRYRQKDVDCVIEKCEEGRLYVSFPIPQRAITKRQSIVFYLGETCLGGAMIEDRGPSFYEQEKALPEAVTNL